MNSRKRIATVALALTALLGLGACSSDADVASRNVSKAADNFEVPRRIVFYNGITEAYVLEVIGYCSLGNDDDPGEVTITCKTGPGEYKKHFLGLSDNVTYFAEQLEAAQVSADRYQVNFKPTTIIPDIRLR